MKRSWPARLGRWALWLLATWFVLTISVVLLLRWIDPPTSAFMLRERLNADQHTLKHRWANVGQISGHIKIAVIAAEDQNFARHHGFDLKAIHQALEERERRRRVRGASTISQQVAKNLFLWPGQNWLRKGLEAYFTVLIELLWPKKRILEMYLNIAEFGRGIYGVDAASHTFFRKSPSRLTASEAALLAAVLPNPKRMRVQAPSRYVRSRQQWIARQMQRLGGAQYLQRLE